MKRQRAFIGLDAADLNFIRAHKGDLPYLAGACGTGGLIELETPAAHLSGSVWPTFFTGLRPGEHGIHHHLQWDAAGMRVRRVTPDWLPAEPFWRTLDRAGLRVIAFDVPMLYPAKLEHGVEIVNWGSHDQLSPFETHPGAIGSELISHFGRHPMGAEIPVSKSRTELRRIRQNLIEGAQRKAQVCKYLIDSQPWDLFVAVFGESHRGGHILWAAGEVDASLKEALLEVYQALDRAVADVATVLEQQRACLTLFALHGMGANTSQEYFVRPVMERANTVFLQKDAAAVSPPGKFPLVKFLRERVPASWQNAVAQNVPVSVRDWVVQRQVVSGLDWSATPGFALLADLHGYVRFNLLGREANGMLEPNSDQHVAYRDWLERCFHSLRVDPTDEPVVAEIIRSELAYPGSASAHLPDLIIVWNDLPSASRVRSSLLGDFDANLATGRSGNHRPVGFVAVQHDDHALRQAKQPREVADLASFFSAACQ